jgi:hypothetical protein
VLPEIEDGIGLHSSTDWRSTKCLSSSVPLMAAIADSSMGGRGGGG